MSKEIVAVSKLEAMPGQADAVQQAYDRPLSDELRKAGCSSYDCYRHLHESNVFVAIGRWESLEAFQEHLRNNEASINETTRLLAHPPELLILSERDAS